MAAPTKKRAIEKEMESLEAEHSKDNGDMSDGSEEGMEEFEEEEDDEVGKEVEVDFEARNPEDSDFHGIRKLLQQLLLKANINLSEIADTVISQNYIGSIIRQVEGSSEEEDEDEIMDVDDIFGIISVLNITERQNLESVKELKSFVLNKCQQCAQKHHEKLNTVLHNKSHQVGFVINERFINIPAQIALPSFESLWKEVDRAKNKKKMKYDFDYILMISKTHKLQLPVGATAGKKNGAQGNLLFTNEEEEFFHEEAEVSFEYSVKEEHDTVVGGDWDGEEGEMEPLRTVMLIPAQKIEPIMQKLRDNLALAPTN